MATLTTILAGLRTRLDESAAAQWSDAELTNYINEGLRDVARRLEVLQDTASVNIVAGTNEYTLATDIIRVHRVEYIDSDSQHRVLKYLDFNALDSVGYASIDSGATGDPVYYTLWGYTPALKIVLFPKPDTNVTNGLKVFFYSLPDDLTTGADIADIPEGWVDLVYDYAEYTALRRDRDPRWTEVKGLYEQKVADMRNVTRRWTDQGSIFTTERSFIPQWLYDPDW